MNANEILQIVTGAIASFGFAILFNIRDKKLLAVTLGGALSWAMFLLLMRTVDDEAIAYFIVSVWISLYAEIMARLMKSPTTVFIVPSLIPMVPGASLYRTMVAALDSSTEDFAARGVETLKLSSAIALGLIVAVITTELVRKTVEKFKNIHEKS